MYMEADVFIFQTPTTCLLLPITKMGWLSYQNNKPLCLRDEEFSQFGVFHWLFILGFNCGFFCFCFLVSYIDDDRAFSSLKFISVSMYGCLQRFADHLLGQLWCFGSHLVFKRLNGEEKSFYYPVCTAQNYSPSKGKWSQVSILNHFWTGFETGSRCFCMKHWALSWNQQIWEREGGGAHICSQHI